MRSSLKWLLITLGGAFGALAILVIAMWASLDVRYDVVYFLSEHFDLNDPISAANLKRQSDALRRVELVEPNGNRFDWRATPGAIIWINEWANWCVPCRMEFPEMKSLRDRVGKDKLRIVLLSQPRYWDADKRTAKDLGLDFEMVTPLSASARDLAAINLARDPNQFLLPESTFMRTSGKGLAAFHAVRPWNSITWETIVRHWYAEGPNARPSIRQAQVQ